MRSSSFVFATILAATTPANGQVVVTRVANESTIAPGGTLPFTGFDAPVIDGSTVVFTGAVGNSSTVYSSVAGAISAMLPLAPNVNYSAQGFKNGTVVYTATSGAYSATFGLSNGTSKPLINTSTPIPGGTGTFTGYAGYSINNGAFAFGGGDNNTQGGIYTTTGGSSPVISLIANQNTPIPGADGANFTSYYFGGCAISGNRVAFEGGVFTNSLGQWDGIYERVGQGPITVIANKNTPLPGGNGNFSGYFDVPVEMSGSNVSFICDQKGIYARINGTLRTIADGSTPSPNGTGEFINFGDGYNYAPIDGSSVAFIGYTATTAGVYLYDGSALRLLIDSRNPIFDGQVLGSFHLGPGSLSGNRVSFLAEFDDGHNSSGVYLATYSPVPEPSTLALAGFAAMALLRGCRRSGSRRGRTAPPRGSANSW